MLVTYNHEYPKQLRTGFIGCGGHAYRNVYPTFQYAPVNLVAVCDLDPVRATNCAKVFGAERHYSDHLEMLAREELDVVFIVTNVDEHGRPRYPKLAIDCLRAGAHVWVEKPPASSSGEIREMIRISSETERHVAVGFKKMFFPANVKAKEIVSRPEFGSITSITARYPQSLPPFEDRGDSRKRVSFLDHIVHPHSVLRLLGGPIEWIFVNRNSAVGSAIVSIRFTSGAAGNLHLSTGQSSTSFLERLEIIGDGENLVVEKQYSPDPQPAFQKQNRVWPFGRLFRCIDGRFRPALLGTGVLARPAVQQGLVSARLCSRGDSVHHPFAGRERPSLRNARRCT
jgi:predicted dehydrogenase